MLPEFKKRIDTLRDILVGAVPSPAGQIEQITYALIYKFMSDIDDRAASLPGGKRTYFTDEYEKYGWHELMTPTLGAHERLTLYREALSSLAKNPGLPELFQGIYQNAYLPFNDPRVLTLFLKEIDNFKHSTSDDIGDAYEYLLQITGAQGDVGQFRTPRHIIKFIVEAVNPTKTDSVLDPAVGTAGFLIAAYNHVKHHHDGVDDITGLPNENETRLTADEKERMNKNYHGFDIDPTMVRTAKVNMYLHGFTTPDIKNHDSLSSEDYWNERYDVILANPPFMTPKGGIKPHDKFGIVANRAEVLFVDYIASHLKPTGRAGIVVPEGIIFQSGKAYKELRKNLVENYLYAVVSLPAGVFQPYSGVKTSVLLLDKELAKRKDEILFVKIENDGFSLSSQRRGVAGSQFPETLELIKKFKNDDELSTNLAHTVLRHKIAENSDYNLSGDRYVDAEDYNNVRFPVIPLSKIVSISTGKKDVNQGNPSGKYPFFTCAQNHTYSDSYSYDKEALLIAGNGDVGNVKYYNGKFEAYQRTYILSDFKSVEPLYLYHILDNTLKPTLKKQKLGNTMPYIKMGMLADYKIPLPPIEIQRQIVAELDGYQKIVDAAQTIVHTYTPSFKIDTGWPHELIKNITKELFAGGDAPKNRIAKEPSDQFRIPIYSNGLADKALYGYTDVARVLQDAVTISARGTIGNPEVRRAPFLPIVRLIVVIPDTDRVLTDYLRLALTKVDIGSTGNSIQQLTVPMVKDISIPLPPLETQRKIVAKLEAEQQLVNANKKLVKIYQQKIKTKIAEVWGE